MNINVNNISVLLIRKDVKNINLRIQTTGEVHLSVPKNIHLTAIYSYLDKKLSWIQKHQERLKQVQEKKSHDLVSGALLLFQGVTYTVELHETLETESIELMNNQFHFFCHPNTTEIQKNILLKQWYKSRLAKILPSLFAHWQSVIGVTVNKIKIRDMKSLWGSCHCAKKCITINLRLIEKPLECLEYIIVHELIHLLEPSHNDRFHRLIDYYLPDWKNIKKKLR